jgi:hypothetical protein
MIRENLAMVGVRMGGKLLGAVTAGVVGSGDGGNLKVLASTLNLIIIAEMGVI